MTKFSNDNYDLEERTAVFGENIIDLCKNILKTSITRSLVNQIVRSGTSIGANYTEANGAGSKKDFRNKIYICKKEAQETKHWLRTLTKACDNENQTKAFRKLWQEAKELLMIFHSIVAIIDKKKK